MYHELNPSIRIICYGTSSFLSCYSPLPDPRTLARPSECFRHIHLSAFAAACCSPMHVRPPPLLRYPAAGVQHQETWRGKEERGGGLPVRRRRRRRSPPVRRRAVAFACRRRRLRASSPRALSSRASSRDFVLALDARPRPRSVAGLAKTRAR